MRRLGGRPAIALCWSGGVAGGCLRGGSGARIGGAVAAEHPIAFFCAEYGVHRSLPIDSGGLGGLAGDLLKEALIERCRWWPSG